MKKENSTKIPEKNKSYDSVKINKLAGSKVEITGSIPTEIWGKYRAQSIKRINDSISIDGFRKGMVPENILIQKVGEMAILEEMAETALSGSYIEIMLDNKIDAIGKPDIQVTKLANGNPLEFKIITAVVPEVTLPDYKKISKAEMKKADVKELEVSDKDIEEAILRIRKSRASKEETAHDHAEMSTEESPSDKSTGDHAHAKFHEKDAEPVLPELTDDFVQSLGGDFKDIPDFKNKLSIMLAEQKVNTAKEKNRIRIADALVDSSKIDLPEIIIENELDRTQAQFEADVERMGVKFDDYLKHAKKTLEEIRKEWRPHAEKKAKIQLILNEISKKENIIPSKQEIEVEVNHIIEHYKEADIERVTTYAETVLMNEKVFQWLEKVEK